MPLVRVQVALNHPSGLPEDKLTNTFHFSTADITTPTIDAILVQLLAFYENVPAGAAAALSSFWSTEVAQNGHSMTVYNLDEPAPRVPIVEMPWNLSAAPNGDPLPGEVALCLSFQATPESGTVQARRRGRIYFGRLDKDCSSAGRPTSTLMTSLAKAGGALEDQSKIADSWTWIVLSVANPGTPTRPAYPQTFAAVDEGWVDNAFDTQRRRGVAPTARTTFT